LTKPLAVKLSAKAAQQILEATAWWRANRPAAPGVVRQELFKVIELIRAQPGMGATATNVRLHGVRRVYLSRIRYHVYYQVRSSPAQVELLAFWHASRGTEPDL
jgi:plasmid stabilization system protein ParE